MTEATLTDNVLVMTPSPTLRALLELSLEEAGVGAHFTERAQEGLDFLKLYTPKAIVLDDAIEIDPFSIASRLKMSRRLRDVPVILFIAETDERAKLTAEFARVEHVLTKPVDRKAFGSIVQHLTKVHASA
ncbi:MAG: response regulator [Meiothermus sp.]|nr:response regulator [Meiothermus sp.]